MPIIPPPHVLPPVARPQAWAAEQGCYIHPAVKMVQVAPDRGNGATNVAFFFLFFILGHFPRISQLDTTISLAFSSPHALCAVLYLQRPCSSDAAWCLQSDAVPDSRLLTWA